MSPFSYFDFPSSCLYYFAFENFFSLILIHACLILCFLMSISYSCCNESIIIVVIGLVSFLY
uniref:Uncharacterized protein n=1 Tax=Manihot esculenta TaxID=3983 RepID=A0A2C9W6A2_MANES